METSLDSQIKASLELQEKYKYVVFSIAERTLNEGVKKKVVRERELETKVKGLLSEVKEKLKTIK